MKMCEQETSVFVPYSCSAVPLLVSAILAVTTKRSVDSLHCKAPEESTSSLCYYEEFFINTTMLSEVTS